MIDYTPLTNKLLICGSRDMPNTPEMLELIKDAIRDVMDLNYFEIDTIIQGGARGADALAKVAAKEMAIKSIEFPADWNTLGKAAGHIRNQEMLNYLVEGKGYKYLIAFYPKKGITPGTKHMVRITEEHEANPKTFSGIVIKRVEY